MEVSSSANFTWTEPGFIPCSFIRLLYVSTIPFTVSSMPCMPTQYLYSGMTALVVVLPGPPTFNATNSAAAGPYRMLSAA